ncbi:MAG: hypothetical protein HZB43_07810 [candidate division Zixibacteria bacterium]|nr:hypothetical protein [candidate division Zixibacteria bacterium]
MTSREQSVEMNRRDAGVAFLRNYFDLACYTHRVASKALHLRFNRARIAKLRKILITELLEGNAGKLVSVVTGPKPSSILILEAIAQFALRLYQSTRQLSKLTRGLLALAIGLADRGLLFVYN